MNRRLFVASLPAVPLALTMPEPVPAPSPYVYYLAADGFYASDGLRSWLVAEKYGRELRDDVTGIPDILRG